MGAPLDPQTVPEQVPATQEPPVPPTPPPATPPVAGRETPPAPVSPPPATPPAGGDRAENGDRGETEVTFTRQQQELLDRRLAQSRREGQEQGVRRLLHELGIDSEDNVKTALAELRTRRQAEMTEQQRLQAQAEEAQREVLAANERATRAEDRVRAALIYAEIRAVATDLTLADDRRVRFKNREDALHFLDLADFEVDMDRGTVSGVEKAMRKLASDRPYLVEDIAPAQPPAATAPPEQPATPPAPPAAPPRAPVPPTPSPSNGRVVSEAEKHQAEQDLSAQVRSWF